MSLIQVGCWGVSVGLGRYGDGDGGGGRKYPGSSSTRPVERL